MKSSPAPETDSLYEAAVKALARRARSSAEVRLLLEKKNAGKKQIEAVLKRLQENGYLDDARFARYFASSRLENDLQGKARVRRDLKARGLKEEIAQKEISRSYQGVNEAELLRRYIRRKINLSRALSKPAAVASLFRRLLRAGFRSDTIVQELKRMLPKSRGTGESLAGDELLDSLSEIPENEGELDQ